MPGPFRSARACSRGSPRRAARGRSRSAGSSRSGSLVCATRICPRQSSIVPRGVTLQNLASALLGSQTAGGQAGGGADRDEEEPACASGATILVYGREGHQRRRRLRERGNDASPAESGTPSACSPIPARRSSPLRSSPRRCTGASGRDFITGVVAGYEVMERMAADWIPTVMARGFHAGPVFGIFGAAIAAAKIMGFNADQMHAAISLCTNLAGSNLEEPRSLREGGAVRNAMLAVALAKQGTLAVARRCSKVRPASITPYAGNNTGELTYSFAGETHTSLTGSPPISARTGCSSRRCTGSIRSPATTSPTST